MGLPLILVAVILFAAAYQNQLAYLAKNAEEDIKGFLPWVAAIAAVSAIGLIPKARPVSNALFVLVFLVLFIANKGIFDNIKNGSALKPVSPPAAPEAPGAKAEAPSAGSDVKISGNLGADATGSAGAGVGASASGIADLAGKASNVIQFPKLDFGGIGSGTGGLF